MNGLQEFGDVRAELHSTRIWRGRLEWGIDMDWSVSPCSPHVWQCHPRGVVSARGATVDAAAEAPGSAAANAALKRCSITEGW